MAYGSWRNRPETQELNTSLNALTIHGADEQKEKETQDGEWLSGHPWECHKPDHGLQMNENINTSAAKNTTSYNWTRSGKTGSDVDLAKIFSNLPMFIESEMEGTVNRSRQELEKLVSRVIHTQKQLTSKDLSEFSPYVKEIVDKIQEKNQGKKPSHEDQASGFAEKFKASSLIPRPMAEHYFRLDCEYMLEMYVPDSMLSWFDTRPGTKWIREIKNTEKRWIFIPSFRRAQIALLNWPQDDIVNEESTIRILVVRPSEFDEYVKHCGHQFPVICLPQDEIGAGYARYWIQKIALRLTLKFIWMIDDSIECFYEYYPDKPPPQPDISTEHRRRKFGCVFKRIEEFVKEADGSEHPISAMSPRGLYDMRHRSLVLVQLPFVCTPPQGAVYLNLGALSTKNIFYRPELRTLEDMIFGYECELNGLKVFMDNRVLLKDQRDWSHTGASSPSVQKQKTYWN